MIKTEKNFECFRSSQIFRLSERVHELVLLKAYKAL